MNRFITYILLLSASLALACAPAWAQLRSKVIVVNGGKYESVPPFTDFVTVALFDPITRQYEVKDTIPDQSVQDLEIVGDTAIVVSDGGISTYKLPGMQPISRNGGVKGIRNIIAVGNKLYASRGFGSLPGEAFVYVFDRNTLQKTGEVTGIPTECDDIILAGGKVYVSMPGEFGSDTGSLVRINPVTDQLDSLIRLANAGSGIGKLAAYGNTLYAFCNRGFGFTVTGLIQLNWTTRNVTLRQIPTGMNYVVPIVVADTVYGRFANNVTKYNYTKTIAEPIRYLRNYDFAGLAVDTLLNQFYVSSADYISNAKLFTMNQNGTFTDSLTVGIAPEKVGVFYYLPTSTKNPVELGVTLSPNPANQWLDVRSERHAAYQIVDATGREYKAGLLADATTRLDVAGLAPGVYQLILQTDKGHAVRRFVKI